METQNATVTNEAKSQSNSADAARLPEHKQSPASELPFEFIRRMHGTAGNRETGRWLQTKLKVGAADDAYEQEADRVADRVMRMSTPVDHNFGGNTPAILQRSVNLLQKKEESAGDAGGSLASYDEEEALQRKCAECANEDELLQRRSTSAGAVAPSLVEETLRSSGQPLDSATRSFMEPRFGHDFGQVQIHTDMRAAESARSVNALAYTVGPHVVFDSNRFAPQTREGRYLLAHELTHVMQQSGQASSLTTHAGHVVQRSPQDDLEKIKSNLSYGVFDWAITDKEAVQSLEMLKRLPRYYQGLFLADEKYSRRLLDNLPPARIPELSLLAAGVSDIAPPAIQIAIIQSNLSYGLFDWAITDREAEASLAILKTLPTAQVAVAFASINYERLLDNIPAAHKQELIHLKNLADAVNVGKVEPRAANRRTRVQIFGPPAPGMLLRDFDQYIQQQADWFVEPSLTAPDRDGLWRLVNHVHEGPHVLNGIGDVSLNDLLAVAAADWVFLLRFCAATYSAGHTVRFFPPLPLLADRIAFGHTLRDVEAVIDPKVLEVTVSQSQILRVQTSLLVPQLTSYWNDFQPFLEQTFTPALGATGPEFERVLTLLTGPAIAPALTPLRGVNPDQRWVRNLHRFPRTMLDRLVLNLGDFSGVNRLILVLHTGHDAPGAFQDSAGLFNDLAIASPNNLVLMIEGPTSLAAVTGRIPNITSTWGQIVGGMRRISQVLIAGHGSAQTVGMAGAGAPAVNQGQVSYAEQNLITGDPATQLLLHALFNHMDPAAARILYAGCLVGSTHVALGTSAAAIPGALAAHQSLGGFTNQIAGSEGIPPGRVQAARASVALGQATRLFDPITGDLAVTYPFDSNAFGSANTYTQSGHEPEGVLRAAVEVGALNKVTAETLLRTRLAMPPAPLDWYDFITRLLVGMALPSVAGSGVDLKRLNDLANVAEIPFLVLWPQFNIVPAHFTNVMNLQPFALDIYNSISANANYTVPALHHTQRLRIVVDQGWLRLQGAAIVPRLLAGIAAGGLSASAIENFLDPAVLNTQSTALLPMGGVPTPIQIRLALAWFQREKTNAYVKAFLSALVQHPPNAPAVFNPAAQAEITLAGSSERSILDDLGFSPAAESTPPVGGETLPLGNLALPDNPALNRVLVSGNPYLATVKVAQAHVYPEPAPFRPAITTIANGAQVQVAGEVGEWRAVDAGGRLGFVHKSELNP